MGLDGEKTRRINTPRPHLFTWSSARETRASPWARASARPQSWPVGEGISVRLSPRAEDLSASAEPLASGPNSPLRSLLSPLTLCLQSPRSVRSPVQTWPVRVDGTLTMGVLYLWLTTSLISGTKTGRAKNKTESSKLRVVPSSPRRRRPAQGPSLRAAPRAAAQAMAASVQPLQEERTRPQTLP